MDSAALTDTLTVALTGQLPFIMLLAAALAWPVSLALLALYRRAVLRSMHARANPLETEPAPAETAASRQPPGPIALTIFALDQASPITAGPKVQTLCARALRAPWFAAAIYAGAGFCYALVMAASFLVATGIEFLPLRFLALFWNYAWPIVLTVNLVAASTRRTKLMTTAGYFLVLASLGTAALASSPELSWGQIAVLWLVTSLPATVLLLAFLNRRIRAVGPLVLTFMLLAVTGANLTLSIASSDEQLLRTIVELGWTLGLDAKGIFIGLIALGFTVLGLAGWLAVRWLGYRYERKQLSDQSITLDALWLLFGVTHATGLVFEGAVWILAGLGAFFVYKVFLWTGFSLLGARPGSSQDSPKLLLLRVFSLGRRSERLFDTLGKRWRHIGSIQLIAGPDLATTTIEPHEFLDFLSGKLARRFIDGPQTLALRFSEMDIKPDPDGRFRVNEFFCHEDTWKTALSQLVGKTDAVLMDLRGFSAQNAGCLFEINELINLVPLERVVFIVDATTDEQFLHQVVKEAWMRMRPTSPNRLAAEGQLCLFRFSGSGDGEFRQLLRSLCRAAQTPSPKVT